MTFITWTWLNVKDKIQQHTFQCYSVICGVFFKEISITYNFDATVERISKKLFQRKSPSPH